MSEKFEDTRVLTPIRNVAVADNVHNIADKYLTRKGYKVFREEISHNPEPEELVDIFNEHNIDALITRTNLNLIREVFRDSMLQVVVGACKRPNVDVKAAAEFGVEVIGIHENTHQVVEGVMGAISDFATGRTAGILSTRKGEWKKKPIGAKNFTVAGKKLGIAGYGRIGRLLAETALLRKLRVKAHNDSSKYERTYEKMFREHAEKHEVELVDSLEELLEWADILTPHTSLENHLGVPTKGLLNKDNLKLMQGDDRQGILLNFDRHDITPEPKQIVYLLDNGYIKRFETDVFAPEIENEKDFEYPFDPNDPRIYCHPHLLGTNPDIDEPSGVTAAKRLIEWDELGNNVGDSIVYKRTNMEVHPRDKHVFLGICRSTREGMLDDLTDAISNEKNGEEKNRVLSIKMEPWTGDYIPGTDKDRPTAYHIVLAKDLKSRPCEEVMRQTTERILALNNENPGSILSIKLRPTSEEQEEVLKKLRLGK